ncbi:prolyl oligopeptidase family serine peptidase [Xanthocytophaga flava]|uniref:prolyl oligopeptidase family serine peptidase n=1 Tax=Xanthocytophaga flava TaxID=3048013 RepID=UPI0028D2E029|nr:prolyl oligopeptidase family serine peptidase [Xanthocytophaga flavus]MDJ1471322.1 prolyl oligopeptidase family serine peptidase [Xanthocytophaga flavus]
MKRLFLTLVMLSTIFAAYSQQKKPIAKKTKKTPVTTPVSSDKLQYPKTQKIEHTDTYHGTTVADPYRWLENDTAKAVKDWVTAENKVTFSYLDKIPYRKDFQKAIEKVYNYPKYSAPFRKGEWFYFYKNDGLQNQSVLYRQQGLTGVPEMVIDPNKLSPDGTTRLSAFSLSKDGNYAGIGLSKGGSDWQEYYVMDTKTKQNLSDKLEWVKVSGMAWQGNGFYYSRYPKPEGSELAAKNENHQVWFHQVGTAQSADKLVFEDKNNLQRFHTVQTTEDEKFVILTISDRSKGLDGNAVYYMDDFKGRFEPMIQEITNNSYGVIDNDGKELIVLTNDGAPNYKIVRFNTETSAWKTIITEKSAVLTNATIAGGKLFVSYLQDVTNHVYVYDLMGNLENEIQLPGPGTASGFGGDKDDTFVFYTFTSFTYPPTIYKYDIATKKSEVFRKPEIQFNPEDYETKQVFYPSKDNTKIPMFITYKKGMKLDGNNVTLLYGYGGFNVTLNPSFSPFLIPFLDQGGVYAQANLRGGGEYGEKWHEQGMKLKKQNVFDDFISAGEYLISEKYTSKEKLAIRGGSNGGLLVGAVINQRPDLFKVAIPQVGVMDMLRFHKFTIGWNWIADYGSADNAEEFKVLYGYSPIHNIKEAAYPATLITTADHDDRVVPAHSFKYAATLQEKQKGTAPVLIRVDVNSGHGASNTQKNIETTADIYSFIFYNMNVKPVFPQ